MARPRASFEAALRELGDSVQVRANPRPPAAAAIAALGKRLGVKLPAQYLDFLRRRGGLLVRASDAVFPQPRLEEHQVVEAWRTQNQFAVFGIDAHLDVEAERRKFRRKTKSDLVPFARRAGVPGYFCFDARGKIWDWESANHEPRLEKESFYGVLGDCVEGLAEAIEISREDLKERDRAPAAAEAWQQKFLERMSGWNPTRLQLELELAISEARLFETRTLLDAKIRLDDYSEALSFIAGDEGRGQILALLYERGIGVKG